MLHTIQLSEASEQTLLQIAKQGGQKVDDVLAAIAETLLGKESKDIEFRYEAGVLEILPKNGSEGGSVTQIRSTPDVMGGDACIRNTRVPVWQLVQLKQAGYTEDRILSNYPGLTAADLISAWDYFAAHSVQIESERRAHQDAA